MCNFLSVILTREYEVLCQASLSSNSHEDIVEAYNLSDLKIGKRRDWLRVEFVPNGSVEGKVQWEYKLDEQTYKEKLPSWYDKKKAEEVVSFVATLKIKKLLNIKDIENLQGVDLKGVDFFRTNLKGVNLQEANLEEADFEEANLQGANLQGANLQGANIEGANLEGANLKEANLRWANLQGANLEGANLEGAKLRRANLRGVNFKGTNYEVNL